MTAILCFGDSNTWGFDPEQEGERLPRALRWTGILQNGLGPDAYVIEEGLCGRSAGVDDMAEGFFSGKADLLTALRSHRPLDAVVIALGTNDLKDSFARSAEQVARSLRDLGLIAAHSRCGPAGAAPAVLFVPPSDIDTAGVSGSYFSHAPEKLAVLRPLLAQACRERSWGYVEAGETVPVFAPDGVHFGREGHRILAAALTAALAGR